MALKSQDALKTIGEAAKEIGVATHVLRFWEQKFSQVNPQKRRGKHRFYNQKDMQVLHEIKTLLYDEGYTIKGAKQYLKQGGDIDSEAVNISEKQESTVLLNTKISQAKSKHENVISEVLAELKHIRSMINQ